MVVGEVEIGACNSGQGNAGVGTGGPNRIGEFAEPVDSDGISDLLHAGEVLVEDGLAVFDLGGQATGGDGIPAFGLGQPAGRCDDQLSASRPLALPAIFDGHDRKDITAIKTSTDIDARRSRG